MPAFDHDRRIGQRPRHLRQAVGQVVQPAIHRGQAAAGRQQLRQFARDAHFLKIEIRQPAAPRAAHAARRAVPMSDRGDRHAQQLGQHRGRVQPRMPWPESTSPSRAHNSDSRTSSSSPSPSAARVASSNSSGSAVSRAAVGRVIAHDDHVGRFARPLDDLPASSSDQLLGFAPRHAGQLSQTSTTRRPASEKSCSWVGESLTLNYPP